MPVSSKRKKKVKFIATGSRMGKTFHWNRWLEPKSIDPFFSNCRNFLSGINRIVGEKSMACLAKLITGLVALALGVSFRYLAAFPASVGLLLSSSGAHAAKRTLADGFAATCTGSIAEMAADLHNMLLVVITLISLFVLGLLVYVGIRFRASANMAPTLRRLHTTRSSRSSGQ